MEHDDDVSVHYPDGIKTLEQTKSALSANPLTNYSKEFWKAIYNWLNAEQGALAKNRYQLYVVPPHQGEWAALLNAAKTSQEVLAASSQIIEEAKKKKPKPACMAFMQKFIDATDAERFALVSNFTIESIHNDPVEPIRNLIKLTVNPAMLDSVCQWAIGTAKDEAERLIRNGQPALISAESFQARFASFVQTLNLPNNLVSFSVKPNAVEVSSILSKRPPFIRQLELIEADSDQRINAVSDYMRTSADKTTWSEDGIFLQDDLDSWDNDLLRRFNFIKNEVDITQKSAAEQEQGKLLYSRCSQVEMPFDGKTVPNHFIHGSYNILADQMKLGWHPQYVSLIKAEED